PCGHPCRGPWSRSADSQALHATSLLLSVRSWNAVDDVLAEPALEVAGRKLRRVHVQRDRVADAANRGEWHAADSKIAVAVHHRGYRAPQPEQPVSNTTGAHLPANQYCRYA